MQLVKRFTTYPEATGKGGSYEFVDDRINNFIRKYEYELEIVRIDNIKSDRAGDDVEHEVLVTFKQGELRTT